MKRVLLLIVLFAGAVELQAQSDLNSNNQAANAITSEFDFYSNRIIIQEGDKYYVVVYRKENVLLSKGEIEPYFALVIRYVEDMSTGDKIEKRSIEPSYRRHGLWQEFAADGITVTTSKRYEHGEEVK
jgi:hypothetical protein